MKAPTAIFKSLSLRRIQPRAKAAAVVPMPATTRFDRELTAELDTLQSLGNGGGELELAQFLDAAITTQKIALNSLVKISHLDDVDRGVLEEYLENNIDILDACNYFVERIEAMKKFGNSLRIVDCLLVNNGSVNRNNKASIPHLKRFCSSRKHLYYSETGSSKEGFFHLEDSNAVRKQLRRMLRQKLGHESEFSEIVCGSKAMALMSCKFIGLALSFNNSSKSEFPMMKECHPLSCSWLRLLKQLAEETEENIHKSRYGSLVKELMELKEVMKGKKGKEIVRSSIGRIKSSFKELEDELDCIEGRVKDLYKCLIDVRMALLGILSQA